MTLKRFFTNALEKELRRCARACPASEKEAPWMAGFGELADLSNENRRVIGAIEGGVRNARPRRHCMILDTNALSAWAEGDPAVEASLRSAGQLVVPSIVLGEYYFGIRQSPHRDRYEDWLRRYLPLAEIATVIQATADAYADIRLELKRRGNPIPPNDVWIAALARQHVLPVLSNDAHFDVVEGIERIAFAPAD